MAGEAREMAGWATWAGVFFLSAAAIAVAAGTMTFGVDAADAAHPGANGVIAFDYLDTSQGGTGFNEVWTSNADGTDAGPLDWDPSTLNSAATLLGTAAPAWAPDGEHLLVGLQTNCAYGACGAEIAIIDTVDGTARQLTCDGSVAFPGPADECRSAQFGASMSRAGTQVAFLSSAQSNEGVITVRQGSLLTVPVTRNCTGDASTPTSCDVPATVLTNDSNATYGAPSWSPDGKWLATVRTQFFPEIKTELVALRTDGTGDYVVLAADLTNPDWSPDGSRILVTGAAGNSLETLEVDCDATTCTAGGTETVVEGALYRGVFSPDGTRVAVDYATSSPGGGFNEIWHVAADGSGDPQQVTSAADLDGATTTLASWQPVVESIDPPVSDDQAVTTGEGTAVAVNLDVTDTSGETLDFHRWRPDPRHPHRDRAVADLHPGRQLQRPRLVHLVGQQQRRQLRDRDSVDHRHPGQRPAHGCERHGAHLRRVPDRHPLAGQRPRRRHAHLQPRDRPSTQRRTVTISGSTATYTPPKKFTNPATFTYRVSDGVAQSAPATVTVAVNRAPVSQTRTLAITAGAPVAVTLTATDPDGDPVTFALASQFPPLHGTLTGTAPNLTYTPAPGFVGLDQFGYTVSDGQLTIDNPPYGVNLCSEPDGSCKIPRRRNFR